MRYPIYPMKAEKTFMSFEFFSERPKGLIKKRIQFQITHREDLFNLAFGDIDDETNDFDDKAVSNNGDSEKVLATVAAAVFAFLNK